ncbi:hypothetical protein EGW08_010769 [Elysia chlorotica]|uniref:Uncharacterized protein n=1 Tax=Elysia chlorotica TaxID=188477 RepID=A0A433TIX8_ELYCH|nr:hypothetical protein EGW08_010769 [Elysia chlorotica]
MSCATFLLVTLAVTSLTAHGQPAQKPCLPSQIQFMGRDTKGRQSVEALDYNKRFFGMKRDLFRMVKDFSTEDAKRYDIEPTRCDVYNIDKNMDFPKCVPGTAKPVSSKHGDAWMFHNVDGATLLYSLHDPSSIFEKISPDGQNSVTYFNFSSAITDSGIFAIPDSCYNYEL